MYVSLYVLYVVRLIGGVPRIIDIRKGTGLATLFNTIHDLRFSYFE